MDVYQGDREKCAYCQTPFKRGQVITVDRQKRLVFCYSYAERSRCVINYTFRTFKRKKGKKGKKRKTIREEPMFFKERPQ